MRECQQCLSTAIGSLLLRVPAPKAHVGYHRLRPEFYAQKQRRHPTCCAAQNGKAEDASFKAEGDPLLQRQIDDAAEVVTALMEDINERLFVPTAIADITGDVAEVTEEQAVRQAVEQRIDSLDDSFIGAVRAFEVAARAQSLDDVADRLNAIEHEVMQQVGTKLPPEMILLDEVQQISSSEARVERLKQAVEQGSDSEAACQLTTLQSVANQVLDDMEDKEVVPNRQLLSRLCLVREELAVVAAEIEQTNPAQAREYAEAKAAYQKLVPMGTAAFLKELIPVGSPERRQALLSTALEDAFSEEAGKSKQGHRKDALRPGKLLTLMSGMQRELSQQNDGQHAQTLRQLESIRLKLMQLLESIAYP
ncbi:g10195 [Coccomyxa viridis]|uniref:G10195 protein n=1 Tax=Coccomyxa viridis TaxID=1274662 RepID=A0ABP1G7G9_9CHLO